MGDSSKEWRVVAISSVQLQGVAEDLALKK
jgi:hypothetical protein